MKKLICLNPADNVAVALQPLTLDQQYTCGEQVLDLIQPIDKGHKVALTAIAEGEDIIKYGFSIGRASQNIQIGEWVHTHNVITNLADTKTYQYLPELNTLQYSDDTPRINVYRRSSGDVAIRNELWIIPTVGCVNGIASQIAAEFRSNNPELNIDGVHVFPHQFGCSQLGDDASTTTKLLQSMALHPNAGGVLVIGLGCENNQVSAFEAGLAGYDPKRVKFLVSQSIEDEVEAGVEILEQIYQVMRHDQRTEGRLSELKIGLECGGSDGLSGITANPLLGQLSDYLTYRGGTTVLTEVPEMFGAEQLLMARCINESVFEAVVDMVNGFKNYYAKHDQPIYENPSPGNKMGGITTLEDKSLGCTQKAGTSKVQAVVGYGERIIKPGLNLLNAPGNDAIATSALGASGCHIVLFTTGRGTPYGGFVPTLKVATNSELAQRKKRWIDFDAGRLVDTMTMPDLLAEFIELLVQTANGAPVKNEQNNIRELAIWKNGVTL